MGDAEYLYVWQKLLLPVAVEFDPDLVVGGCIKVHFVLNRTSVSAGFDAAKGDPLGECTKLLLFKAVANPMSQGGYNIEVISKSAAACVRAMLGDPVAPLTEHAAPKSLCIQTVDMVISHIRPYWSCFGKQAFNFASGRLPASTYPLNTALQWYSRSILAGLLNLKPLALPQTKIIGKGVVAIESSRFEDERSTVDPFEVYARQADGPASYYNDFISRGHPIVTTEIRMDAITRFSKLTPEDALIDAGERTLAAVLR
ncbi:Histone deacetylase 6 [Phlyctochytrium bullatum]|nr:Histone deacetylase 6 [Phlyctochytrium bullatum]